MSDEKEHDSYGVLSINHEYGEKIVLAINGL
jgi:hypothetical protein